ncbi:MAG: hypothetical protein K2Q18_05510 [Bdellovibrionales bacterium]|nr:hypothetical protein [Bdellovibrionales bacterium]
MKKLINLFESKRSLAGLALVAGLIFTTYNIQENAGKIKRLTNFENGIQTCFTRVNQTYTANLLGDTASNYLTQNFQNLTEECLAEGILSAENVAQEKQSVELAGATKLLSNLASNVHWFHEDILAPVGAKNLAGKGEARDVGTRFEKIETTKDEILEITNNNKTVVTNSLNSQKNIFYVAATLLVILMLAEYMSLTRRRLSNGAREKEAGAELLNNGGVTSVKVGEIIRVALEQNDLVNCSRLFANFHNHTISEKGKNKMSLETLVTPIGTIESKNKNAINKLWEDDSVAFAADSKAETSNEEVLADINLEQTGSLVVDLLAEKLFSLGVQLDLNIPENLMIRARQEELEQAFFHLFAYAINSTHESVEKKISIFAHKLGDVVAFDLSHTGTAFSEATLKHRTGLATAKGQDLDLDLQVCQSLFNEMNSKIQLDNKIDQNGNTIGGRVKIIFKGSLANQITQGRLVDIKVGSKKDILAALSGATTNELM